MTNILKVNPEDVISFWQCLSADCDSDENFAEVPADWYQDNGTPTCECGCDMSYLSTEVKIEA